MTLQNYTHLTMVVDRSGSMSMLADAMNKGIEQMLREQFQEIGRFTFTLVDFDNQDSTIARMSDKPVEYTLVPRGNTALLDATGREIVRTGEDLAALPEDQRPERVLFAVFTDGQENASREYEMSRIQAMIKEQGEQYGWQFQFIGAEEAAWQAGDLGMKRTSFRRTQVGTQALMTNFNDSMKSYRLKPSFDVSFDLNEEIDEN